MHILEHRIPPPVVAALIAAGMWAVSDWGPRVSLAPELRIMMVGLLAVAGLAFDVLGLLAFRAMRTTINPLDPGSATALTTGGVYRITRNPMYLGMVLFLLAWTVHLSALLPLAGVLLFMLYITRFQIQPEERALSGIFGEAYAGYTARVRRWL